MARKNTLKAAKISSLSSSSRRCGIVGKLNKQTKTGAVPNTSDCWQVCQSKRLSTCQGCVVKFKDFVHATRSNCLATNFEGSSGDTQTQSKTARRLCLCVRLRTQPQLSRYSITLLNCVAFVAFYNLFLYLCGFFLNVLTVSHLSHFDLTASHN